MKMINCFAVIGALSLIAAAGNAQDATAAAVSPQCDHSHGSSGDNFFSRFPHDSLNIGGDFQFRYTFNSNDSLDNDNTGFNIPLATLRASGQVQSSIDYMIEADFNSSSGDAFLRNAYAGFTFDNGSRIQLGQFHLPFLHEVNVRDSFQLAVDRSVSSYVFGQGYSQGVELSYDIGDLRLVGAFSDGFDTDNTGFTDSAESDVALTARADYVIMGSRSVFDDFTSMTDSESSLMIGSAFHYQEGDTQDTMYSYTGDITWESHGWNAFLSGVGRNTDTNAGTFDDFGVAVQTGYRVTETIEPFVRYDMIMADSGRGFANDNFNFVTVGSNYYLYGQAARFTADVVWSLDETSGLDSMSNFSNTGLLGSTDENEFAVRAQFQLLF